MTKASKRHPRRTPEPPAPPPLSRLLTELPRSGVEASKLLLQLRQLIKQAPRGDDHPVLALPGYGGSDASMALIRYFIGKIGYRAHSLQLGVNFEPPEERIMRVEHANNFRNKMTKLVIERIEQIHRESGNKVTLVGWSMGGLYAVDASQQVPNLVRRVITLGAPYGDPRSTSTFNLLRWLNRSTVPIEEQDFSVWLDKRVLSTSSVPINVVYSEQDGIIAAEAARLEAHPSVEYFEVDSSHVGFAVNPQVFQLLGRLLAV